MSEQPPGFTMIELLMVIMLIAILGAVALPQFLDFRTEGRAAAANGIVSSINTGIALQKANARLRCAAMGDFEIPLDSFQANDVTSGASPLCTTSQVINAAERRIIESADFPANPYNNLNTVGDCVNTTFVGYCYDVTSGLAAVSTATSHSNTCTSCFQVANGVGTSTLGCSGSGCVQICNGISGDCTIDCPGGYCNQTCNGISGNCNLSCDGGNCAQLCNGVSGSCTTTCVGGNCTT